MSHQKYSEGSENFGKNLRDIMEYGEPNKVFRAYKRYIVVSKNQIMLTEKWNEFQENAEIISGNFLEID